MAFRELECTQGVWGYQTANRTFVQKGGKRLLAWALRPPPARCRRCGSRDVRAYSHRVRTLAGLPVGRCPVRFLVPVRKVICRRCGCATYERAPFAARRDARITRALASAILALARETSMSAMAGLFGVSWRTVRDAIADGLRKRYRKRDFGRVRNLGIDELHVFARERPSRRYVTVVRDLDSGEVLEVARGKGGRPCGASPGRSPRSGTASGPSAWTWPPPTPRGPLPPCQAPPWSSTASTSSRP